MSDALTKALLRRERILVRIDLQRRGIAQSVAGLSGPIAVLDHALNVGRLVRAHPVTVALVAVALLVRARGVFGLAARGFGAWRLYRRLRGISRHFKL